MSRGTIIFISILVLAIGGFIFISQSSLLSGLSLNFLDGQKDKAIRGDLVIPVTSTGVVESAQIIQVKSKAGGIVNQIPVLEGQMVKKGDILVVLDPVDEKRAVEARQSDADRAKSAWEKAKIALEKAKIDLPNQTLTAEARLADAKARLSTAKYQYDKLMKLAKEQPDGGVYSEQEVITVTANRDSAKAAVDMAEIDVITSKNNEIVLLKSAEEDVVQAQATWETTVKNLEDANQRLAETTVRAPADAMVYSIQTRVGEAIQSGTQSLTGGTPLLILADVSAMFVIAQIDEADIGEIREIAPDYARPGKTQRLEESEYIRKAREIIEKSKASSQPLSNDEKAMILSEAEKQAIEKEGVEVQARPVVVTVDAYRTETYKGVIERILPAPERLTNAVTFKVRIRLIGEDLQKLNGLQADLEFETETKHNVVLVKNEALTSEVLQCYVFVPHRDNPGDRLGEKKIPVKIGATDGTHTEVVAGLKEGEEVWTKRPQLTDKEKRESGG
ncbi:MAG: biotin/lipoyl-binding protein [Planctomycetes bacterium]|nr:biotin/lipoyl-binding protein [Planctomycetota bacterium]